MPLDHGGFDWPWQTEYKAKDDPSNKYFFSRGVYKTKNLLSASEIRDNVFNEMSQAELDKLSPIRKYALIQGDYEMNALAQEIFVRGPERNGPKIEFWEGSCYAMRTTACLLPEPNKVTKRTISYRGKKRTINLYPNDVKALAALTYKNSELYVRAGDINRGSRDTDPVNAAVYHMFKRVFKIMKTRYKNLPYAAIFDVEPNGQLWNEGFQTFEDSFSKVISVDRRAKRDLGAPRGTKYYVDVTDRIGLVHETDIRETNRATRSETAAGEGLNYESYTYRLFLDGKKRIIDGHWMGSETGRQYPDFIGWPNGIGLPDQGGNPYVDFHAVMDILEDSTTEKSKKIPGRR